MSLLGKKAPKFTLNDQDNRVHKLVDYRGQIVLLYFYPKDRTPGCTIEAHQFQQNLSKFKKAGVVVLGVSKDDEASKKKFCDKEGLTFPLLADKDHKVVEKYGVWQEKNMYGKKVMGIRRESFLIDETGTVVKHYGKVKPAEHADEVLADLKLMN